MRTPHEHAAILHAIADGEAVQGRRIGNSLWHEVHSLSALDDEDYEFRVQPHRWQAEIDAQKAGKAVQWRAAGEGWEDEYDGMLILEDGFKYRIKPEMHRFRNYWIVGSNGKAVQATHHEETSQTAFFGGWIGDWQEVEA